jgi:acyl-CoA hydrolase
MESGAKDHPAIEACVEETLTQVGKRIRLGTPLGVGKANHLVNGFYRRATADPRMELTVFTALSLGRPRWSSDLERRFLEPLSQRLFSGYPELDYVDAVRAGRLPDNIRIQEFYFRPGSALASPMAQRGHMSSNYTHVVRDLLDADMNVLAQLVGKEDGQEGVRYSLGSNPDLTVDLVPRLRQRRAAGRRIALLGQVNPRMPFMYGDAAVSSDYFDTVVDEPELTFPLFGVPHVPVDTGSYLIALHVSALVRDGGTLQIGIGSMGDAVTRLLQLRHQENGVYRALAREAGIEDRYGDLVEAIGGMEPFRQGLYAASEMLVDGFLRLRQSGVLRRRVYDSVPLQRLLNQGLLEEEVTPDTLEVLLREGVIPVALSPDDLRFLQRFGILRSGIRWVDGELEFEDGTRVPADLHDPRTRAALLETGLGERLEGGHLAHACFFLGPRAFYEELRSMDPEERRSIAMTGISFVNELYGQEELKRLQRREARFINTGMIATLGGAVASDGLDDGRVVSGVGGQYNFVTMAQELHDGRSILMVSATHERDGSVTSNIRFAYGHVTIPRHLRDIVVTEYGIADLRGKSDGEVATALIEIADSRFQEELLSRAREAGRVPPGYVLPDHARQNRPERLERLLAPHRARGFFRPFPFGTELTDEEVVLRKALTRLKGLRTGEESRVPGLGALRDTVRVPDSARPYLRRLELEEASGPGERLMQRAVVFALSSIGAL